MDCQGIGISRGHGAGGIRWLMAEQAMPMANACKMLAAVGHSQGVRYGTDDSIVRLACDNPEHYQRPLDSPELKLQMVKLGIVRKYFPHHGRTTFGRS